MIASAQALRYAVDLVGVAGPPVYFRSRVPIPAHAVAATMTAIGDHTRQLTEFAMHALGSIPGITIYGPSVEHRRSPLVAFNVAGRSPFEIAERLNDAGVESRAGCHCATLAHRDLGLDPAASCRLSFYLYNSIEDVDQAVDALRQIVTGKVPRHRASSMSAGSGRRHPAALHDRPRWAAPGGPRLPTRRRSRRCPCWPADAPPAIRVVRRDDFLLSRASVLVTVVGRPTRLSAGTPAVRRTTRRTP